MKTLRSLTLVFACAVGASMVSTLSAQIAQNRNAEASRAQIEAALAEAEKIVASPGYSGRIKSAKRREISLMKSRLTEGDLQPGDQIVLDVEGEPALSYKAFLVGAGRTLTLPGLADISVRGVLRSEMEAYMTQELKRYLKSPTVHVQTTIRLGFLGAIGKPGYAQVPAEIMLADAIMVAGGPTGGVDPANTRIERAGIEIMTKESFRQAIIDGKTIDQLNLRAGDEIVVGGSRAPGNKSGSLLNTVLPITSVILSLSYLGTRIIP